MSVKKPLPIVPSSIPKACPVCGKPSYSMGGIHPQCAVSRADAPRRLLLATQKKAKAAGTKQRTWVKTCPKCHLQLPSRKGICECGFDFLRT